MEGKTGSHLIRVLYALRGVLEDGRLTVALAGAEQARCLAVKHGQVPAAEVLAEIDELTDYCTRHAADLGRSVPDEGPVEEILLDLRLGRL